MAHTTFSRTIGLAQKATPIPASRSMGTSFAPSPTAITYWTEPIESWWYVFRRNPQFLTQPLEDLQFFVAVHQVALKVARQETIGSCERVCKTVIKAQACFDVLSDWHEAPGDDGRVDTHGPQSLRKIMDTRGEHDTLHQGLI